MLNVVRAGPIWYGVVVFRHVAGVASVCFGNGPRTTDDGSVDPGVACRIFVLTGTGVHASMSHSGEGGGGGAS